MNLFRDMFGDFFHSLSDKEIIIYDFISSNIIHVCEMNIKELSLKLNVTEYSINKFCKKINVDNFENLISILKEILKTSHRSSNYIFENSLKTFSNFISKTNESQITEICKLILKYNCTSILFSDSSKIIAQYLNQNLNCLNIESKMTSSSKQISKQKEIDLVIYIPTYLDEKSIKTTLKNLSNKIVIVVSDTITKEAHDNSSIFVHVENNNLFKNFNVHCNSVYFIFFDILISKLIELLNIKN